MLRPEPKPLEGDIRIPGDFNDIVEALVTCKNGSSFFLGEGKYHWDELTTPNGTRRIGHDFKNKNDAAGGTIFIAHTLRLRGHPKAELWGHLVFVSGSSGICKYVTLAADCRQSDAGHPSVFIYGRAWQFHECEVRSAGGAAVALAGTGGAHMYECGIGGVESFPTTRAQVGVWVLENSSCWLHSCAVRSNHRSGVIAAGQAMLKAYQCSFAFNMQHLHLIQAQQVKLYRCELHDSLDTSFKIDQDEGVLLHLYFNLIQGKLWNSNSRPAGLKEVQNKCFQGSWREDLSVLNTHRKLLDTVMDVSARSHERSSL
ncbi:hypothetical protein GUITHDRAFT_106138 [Guillardia theta CCMP2712]|uniref:Right handed beta helix domain-containing protein n=1 Tax=Guillardia theta (strain CCMP2712) TaxID=905079 RepID=L1JIS9_GUITC|nr:hypothetical protein GUITHDRAFT_106138 [Guillardia theta CCMP2712]EKX48059.1 hypothetical protein GUITHDRAFT_106138 [Guillardia theta CCMP2712]|eukprot:XP_005835039.1 hypothetical protein GUITHDRAFT_106138 [Guillardia theta CCMP2712]